MKFHGVFHIERGQHSDSSASDLCGEPVRDATTGAGVLMDFAHDMLFESYNDPTVICGCLDCSNTHLQDEMDGENFVAFIAKCTRDSDGIRELVARDTRLYVLADSAFSRFINLVSCMQRVSVARVKNCGLTTGRLRELVFALFSLPPMQGTAFDYPFHALDALGEIAPLRATSELNLKNNGINDALIHEVTLMKNGYLRESPPIGVEKLVLSDNPISDKALNYLVILFPSLKELHISNCSLVTGHKIKEFLCHYFSKLEILSLDGNQLCADAILGILEVMKGRNKRDESPPLEVWLRNVGVMDESWRPLLAFCESKSTRSKFTVKHNFQRFLGERMPRSERSHDVVNVHVFFSGMKPIKFEDHDVLSTTSTVEFVKRVIDDINAMSLFDATDLSKVKIRPRYRSAFQGLIDCGKLRMRMFKAESAYMIRRNIYDDSAIQVDAIKNPEAYSLLIGSPMPGVSISFDITVCEDEENSLQLTVR